jgi:GGDEF domain-containing protein
MDFLYESKYNSVFLVFSLEGYPTLRRQYGKAKSDEILSRISYVVKSNFRGRDICAYLGMGKFGVFMINTFEDEVQYPLQRLRDNLRKEGVLSSKVSFNARYQNVDLELKVDDLLDSIMSKKVDYTINN